MVETDYNNVRSEIVELLNEARAASARSVNALMTATYWEIGRRIVEHEQAGESRAEYGEALIRRLAEDLEPRFGRGFGWRNLTQMRAFFLVWPASKILQTPSAKSVALLDLSKHLRLPWSAYVRLLSVRNSEARAFYETEALRSGWSIRELNRQIGSQFYERLTLSKNKASMLGKARSSQPGDAVTPEEAIKDPFVLEFLDLKDEYSEVDLEQALIQHLTDFLLELGDPNKVLAAEYQMVLPDAKLIANELRQSGARLEERLVKEAELTKSSGRVLGTETTKGRHPQQKNRRV